MNSWSEIKKLEAAQGNDELARILSQTPPQGPREAFNLGTALMRSHQIDEGTALLLYSRSWNQITPEIPADWIEQNIALSRAQWTQAHSGTEFPDSFGGLEKWSHSDARTPVECLLLIFAVMCLVRLFRMIQAHSVSKKSMLLLSLVPLCSATVWGLAWKEDHTETVWLKKPWVLRSGPSDRFLEIQALPGGIPLKLTGAEKQTEPTLWLQIKTTSGEAGWLPADAVLRLPRP